MDTYTFRSTQEARRSFTHKFVITHADLTEATDNTAQDITLVTLPANSIVLQAATYLPTPFQKTGTSAYNSNVLIVGDAGSTNRIIASQQVNVNGTEVLARAQASTVPYAYEAATAIKANFASMASYDLAELDAGEIHIFLQVAQLDTLD
jgi:hypothetical protein